MAMRIISESLDRSPTHRLLHQLNVSRSRFLNHPLYRRWSRAAYENRMAYLAEEVPEFVSRVLPLLFLFSPLFAFVIAVVFGASVFSAILTVLVIMLIVLSLLIASSGPMIAAGLAALSLAHEREAGRWELLMMIPDDRASVVLMRISSILHPYRPFIATLDVLQSLIAIIMVFILNVQVNAADNDVLGLCFLFVVPSLFFITWERRQDYALSVMVGVIGGLARREQHALGISLGGATMMLGIRLLIGMFAFGLDAGVHGIEVVLPVFVAGPTMLLLLGIPLKVSLVLLVLYYVLREIIISVLWRTNMQRVRSWF